MFSLHLGVSKMSDKLVFKAVRIIIKKEGSVLFNDELNTFSYIYMDGWMEMFYLTTHSTHFILRLYGVGHMVKDHSDSERGNPLPPHGLLFPINNKGSFICTIPQTG